jgi:hypothetical protein
MKLGSRVFKRAVCAAAVTLVTLGSPLSGAAQAPETASLIGGWRVTADVGGETSYLVLIVNEGGTVSLRAMDGDKADGVWIRTGRRAFALTVEEFDDVDGDGADERYRSRVTIQLSDRNTLSGTFTIDELTLDGSAVVEMEGQGTLAGTRMIVVRE